MLAAVTMVASMATACGTTPATDNGNNNADPAATTAAATDAGNGETTAAEKKAPSEIKNFTAFHAVPGTEVNDGNVVQEKIAEITGARCKETWLTGQTADEAVGVMIAGGEYPDFITGSTGHSKLLDAGAYIAIDEYWDNYPNIKNYLSDAEWNKVRAEDGHVYIIPQFGIIHGKDTDTIQNGEAFWIQTRVLKDAGYPEVVTLDDYFDLIEGYIEKNPTNADGTKNIGYEILCEDWRYFCLENAPFFLDGYPNDGCCIVDPETLEVSDYNVTPTAKRYFNKLNEEFKKGIIDPETFTMNYDQYIAKISSGRVLGMVDQHWDFQDGENAIKTAGLEGCTYVPLGLVIDEGIEEQWYSPSALDVSNGLGITTSCKDVEGALQFVNDLLSPEVETLRFWGVEGVDYLVGDGGVFYRTDEMRKNADDSAYKVDNRCDYSYFPHYQGMNQDNINAWQPQNQPDEFYESLPADVQECLKAYNARTYLEMLNPSKGNSDWFPMWSYSNAFTTDTPWGMAKTDMDAVKHEYLPKVVMADNFDTAWEEYLKVYHERCDTEAYLAELKAEVDRRVAIARGN